jgi:ABC-type antimicrobial peptide transport system permease subunit
VRNPDADQPPEPHIYLPFAQSALSSMAVIARTSGEPLSILPSVRSAVWELNPEQTIYDARTMDQILFDDLAGNFIVTGLMGYFAFVALGLATAGVFGVVSYFVNERTQEIGIRIALGARFADVVTTVIVRGLAPVVLGVGLGMVGGFAVSRLMMSMMYGVSPTDPLTFGGVPLLLMSVAFLASLIPALRAARIDPIVALRYE